MTENTQGNSMIVNPATGEALDLTGPTNDLAAAVVGLGEVRQMLDDYRHAVEAEIARRMDAANTRKERIGEWEISVNAPTTESYPTDLVREQLAYLIEKHGLDPVVMDRVIVTPDPKPAEAKVDRREINKLLKHPDPEVGERIGRASVTAPARRNVKIERLS